MSPKAEKEILETILKEQRRLGTQLRDGLCQELAGILMFAKSLTQRMEKEKRLDVAELENISKLINGAVKQARDAAQGLYPGELDGTSLMRILEDLASTTQSTSGIACHFHCPKVLIIKDSNVATHLYNIAREGINNAVQHGKPQLIEVSLVQTDGHIILTIKDDGTGFAGNRKKESVIGLKLAQYRTQAMNASFQMKSNVPHGVILTCTL